MTDGDDLRTEKDTRGSFHLFFSFRRQNISYFSADSQFRGKVESRRLFTRNLRRIVRVEVNGSKKYYQNLNFFSLLFFSIYFANRTIWVLQEDFCRSSIVTIAVTAPGSFIQIVSLAVTLTLSLPDE